MAPTPPVASDPPRRSFLAHLAAIVFGAGAFLAPVGAGLAVLADPVIRKSGKSGGNWIRVASREQIPADGRPYAFAVIDPEPWDKWNRYEPQPVGSVYIIRRSDTDMVAYSAVCPHLGCTFDYRPANNDFRCPCHNAMFGIDGKQLEGCTVSPRDLDPLEVEVDEVTGAVKVNYKRFKRGIRDRIEIT
jgi:menaquinol-cytochrome c reductase iron-sulfur subunit